MKKLKSILICLMLCVFGFGLVACGDPRTEEEKSFTYPKSSDYVTSNGGLAVQKGKYVYFVNGYKSVEEAKSKKTNYTVGSLMLMKLGENGKVVTDENGLTHDDYFIKMSNKLCGYEATNLFIHKDYLYFVTPSLENESGDKVWAKERVVFKRIKLDKSSEVETVYSSDVQFDQLQYEYYEDGGKLFILVWEKGETYYGKKKQDALVRVNATNKSSSKISNDVKSVVFAENADEIFFVKYDEDDSKYVLNQYNIVENDVQEYAVFDKSHEVKAVSGGNVFISASHEFGSTTDVKVSNIENHTEFSLLYAYSGSVDLKYTNDGTVLYVTNNVISFVKSMNDVKTITDENATSIDVIGFVNGCVVYLDDKSNVKTVSYSNFLEDGIVQIDTVATLEGIEKEKAYFDLSNDCGDMYFYNKVGENYYLHRLNVTNNHGEEAEMFGVYLEADEPEVETEETEEDVEE